MAVHRYGSRKKRLLKDGTPNPRTAELLSRLQRSIEFVFGMLHRAFRIPAEAYIAVTDFLFGTPDYMNTVPDNNYMFNDLDVEHDNADKNYTSLHL